ncbi:hypothetical protein [Chitinibacter sp. GC72]|uniref:hypothetical protein n=1 Tax=Chitinibacter sp. GC72 TaxID=1526917 RepID=UPI0012FA7EE8|nr:hypothetical protein [Chitinibacter sp. GC72]
MEKVFIGSALQDFLDQAQQQGRESRPWGGVLAMFPRELSDQALMQQLNQHASQSGLKVRVYDAEGRTWVELTRM